MTIVTARELAERINVSAPRIRQYVAMGMPRVRHGKYDLDACLAWLEENADSYESAGEGIAAARERLLNAQADNAEFTLRKNEGVVVEFAAMEAALSNVSHAIVSRLDTWVDQAPNAEEMNQRRECAWSCRDEIVRAFESVCADLPIVSEHQATGLRDRRQVR